jgi:hypothetical protein
MNRLSTDERTWGDKGYCEECAQALEPVEIARGDTICGECRKGSEEDE